MGPTMPLRRMPLPRGRRGLLNLTATKDGLGTGNQARPVAQAKARPAMVQGNPRQEARDERPSRSSGIPT